MTSETVPTPTDTRDPYAELAAELRRTADDVEKLVGSRLAMPTFIQLSVQPGAPAGDETTKAAVDAWALALLGRLGALRKMSDGTYHYDAQARRGPLSVQLYNSVSTEWARKVEHGAEIAKREAEIKRLRAEVAELRSAEDPDHGRTTAVAEAKPDTLLVPHGEAHRTAETFTRYFSFGHGQTDPATGESLRDKYVTVIAATADGCREAMLASRFGREWAFEYVPGRPKTDEWIPQWTEHERIVVDPDGGCE